MTDDFEALKEYGLSENEIKVYINLLKAGEITAQELAKNIQLPRTSVYHLLESLIEKGLASFIIKQSVKLFQPADPKKIPQLLEDKKKRIQEIIPSLISIRQTLINRPKTQIFEGPRGIKTILQDILDEKKCIYHYGDILSLQKALPYIFPQYVALRVTKNIPIKIICKKEEAHGELIKSSKKELREFLFIEKGFSFPSGIFIYNKKVAILSLKKEPYYGIVIENEDFYESQLNVFNLIWKQAKQ
jgi:HTH-type transcriptional regulator, sugar sensing transcriptional regulator